MFVLSHWLLYKEKYKVNYFIVYSFYNISVSKQKTANREVKLSLKFNWPFLHFWFNICVMTLKSPHNLFVLPTIIKKNPSNLNPMSFLFSSPARILPTLQTKSFQPYFSLLPISKNLISLLEKSSSMQKPAAGSWLFSIKSSAEPPNGLRGSKVKVYFFVIVG